MFGSKRGSFGGKRPAKKARRMGGGKGAAGPYQAGYQAGLNAARRKAPARGRSGSVSEGEASRPSYGDDEATYRGRSWPRVGWRW